METLTLLQIIACKKEGCIQDLIITPTGNDCLKTYAECEINIEMDLTKYDERVWTGFI